MTQHNPHGCGDSSCMFGSPGGMATNGGCRCLKDARYAPMDRETERRITRAVLWLHAELENTAADLARVTRELDRARKELISETCKRADCRHCEEFAGIDGSTDCDECPIEAALADEPREE